MKKHLLLLLGALIALPTLARDFTYTYEGQTITYTVINESSKTCKVEKNHKVTGNLILPSTPKDSNTEFTLVEIGSIAFYGCSGLTSITIPNSVTKIDNQAFSGCSGLTKAEFASIEHLCSIYFDVTYSNPLYYAHNLYINGEEVKDLIIPNSVTEIGWATFVGCTGLTSVTIPNSVTEIGSYAFNGCSGLTSVIIGNSVTTINPGAFWDCIGLTSVIIPNSVTRIRQGAFQGCSGLTSVTIPNSVTEISIDAFYGCSGLTSVTIPNSVTEIGRCAFYYCSGLTSITSNALTPPTCSESIVNNYDITLYVPNKAVDAYKSAKYWNWFKNIVGFDTSKTIIVNGLNYIIDMIDHTAVVTYAEQNSLSNYEGIQSVIIPETVEYEGETYTVVGIGDEAFNNCWGLKAVSLPSTLETIGKLAFGYCTSLRSVMIPDEVTVIDTEAFTGCSALASVTIGNSVETIGDYAFFGCTGLATLHVPESVTTIGENAFMGIHWINEVHAKSATPAEAPISAFSTNAYKNATLVVPDGAIDTYKAHPTWTNFMAIREAGNLPTKIEVVDGAIVVKGSEEVRIYNTSGAQVYSGGAGRVELPAGIYLVATDSLTKKVKFKIILCRT